MRARILLLTLSGIHGAKRLTPIDDCISSAPITFTKGLKRELCHGVHSFVSATARAECARAVGRAALNPSQIVELCSNSGAPRSAGQCIVAAQKSLKSFDQLPPTLRLELCLDPPRGRPEAPVECILAAGKLVRKQAGLLGSKGAEWLTSAHHRVELCQGAGREAAEAAEKAAVAARGATTLRNRNATVILAGAGRAGSEAAAEAAGQAVALAPVRCLEAFLAPGAGAGGGGGRLLGGAVASTAHFPASTFLLNGEASQPTGSSRGSSSSRSSSSGSNSRRGNNLHRSNLVAIELCRGAASAAPGECGAAAARLVPATLRPPLELLPGLCGAAAGNSARAGAAFMALATVLTSAGAEEPGGNADTESGDGDEEENENEADGDSHGTVLGRDLESGDQQRRPLSPRHLGPTRRGQGEEEAPPSTSDQHGTGPSSSWAPHPPSSPSSFPSWSSSDAADAAAADAEATAESQLARGPVECLRSSASSSGKEWTPAMRVDLCAGSPHGEPAACAATLEKHLGPRLLHAAADGSGSGVSVEDVVRVCKWGRARPKWGLLPSLNLQLLPPAEPSPSSPSRGVGREESGTRTRPSLARDENKSTNKGAKAQGRRRRRSARSGEARPSPASSSPPSSASSPFSPTSLVFSSEGPYFPSPREVALCVVAAAPLALSPSERFELCDPAHFTPLQPVVSAEPSPTRGDGGRRHASSHPPPPPPAPASAVAAGQPLSPPGPALCAQRAARAQVKRSFQRVRLCRGAYTAAAAAAAGNSATGGGEGAPPPGAATAGAATAAAGGGGGGAPRAPSTLAALAAGAAAKAPPAECALASPLTMDSSLKVALCAKATSSAPGECAALVRHTALRVPPLTLTTSTKDVTAGNSGLSGGGGSGVGGSESGGHAVAAERSEGLAGSEKQGGDGSSAEGGDGGGDMTTVPGPPSFAAAAGFVGEAPLDYSAADTLAVELCVGAASDAPAVCFAKAPEALDRALGGDDDDDENTVDDGPSRKGRRRHSLRASLCVDAEDDAPARCALSATLSGGGGGGARRSGNSWRKSPFGPLSAGVVVSLCHGTTSKSTTTSATTSSSSTITTSTTTNNTTGGSDTPAPETFGPIECALAATLGSTGKRLGFLDPPAPLPSSATTTSSSSSSPSPGLLLLRLCSRAPSRAPADCAAAAPGFLSLEQKVDLCRPSAPSKRADSSGSRGGGTEGERQSGGGSSSSSSSAKAPAVQRDEKGSPGHGDDEEEVPAAGDHHHHSQVLTLMPALCADAVPFGVAAHRVVDLCAGARSLTPAHCARAATSKALLSDADVAKCREATPVASEVRVHVTEERPGRMTPLVVIKKKKNNNNGGNGGGGEEQEGSVLSAGREETMRGNAEKEEEEEEEEGGGGLRVEAVVVDQFHQPFVLPNNHHHHLGEPSHSRQDPVFAMVTEVGDTATTTTAQRNPLPPPPQHRSPLDDDHRGAGGSDGDGEEEEKLRVDSISEVEVGVGQGAKAKASSSSSSSFPAFTSDNGRSRFSALRFLIPTSSSSPSPQPTRRLPRAPPRTDSFDAATRTSPPSNTAPGAGRSGHDRSPQSERGHGSSWDFSAALKLVLPEPARPRGGSGGDGIDDNGNDSGRGNSVLATVRFFLSMDGHGGGRGGGGGGNDGGRETLGNGPGDDSAHRHPPTASSSSSSSAILLQGISSSLTASLGAGLSLLNGSGGGGSGSGGAMVLSQEALAAASAVAAKAAHATAKATAAAAAELKDGVVAGLSHDWFDMGPALDVSTLEARSKWAVKEEEEEERENKEGGEGARSKPLLPPSSLQPDPLASAWNTGAPPRAHLYSSLRSDLPSSSSSSSASPSSSVYAYGSRFVGLSSPRLPVLADLTDPLVAKSKGSSSSSRRRSFTGEERRASFGSDAVRHASSNADEERARSARRRCASGPFDSSDGCAAVDDEEEAEEEAEEGKWLPRGGGDMAESQRRSGIVLRAGAVAGAVAVLPFRAGQGLGYTLRLKLGEVGQPNSDADDAESTFTPTPTTERSTLGATLVSDDDDDDDDGDEAAGEGASSIEASERSRVLGRTVDRSGGVGGSGDNDDGRGVSLALSTRLSAEGGEAVTSPQPILNAGSEGGPSQAALPPSPSAPSESGPSGPSSSSADDGLEPPRSGQPSRPRRRQAAWGGSSTLGPLFDAVVGALCTSLALACLLKLGSWAAEAVVRRLNGSTTSTYGVGDFGGDDDGGGGSSAGAGLRERDERRTRRRRAFPAGAPLQGPSGRGASKAERDARAEAARREAFHQRAAATEAHDERFGLLGANGGLSKRRKRFLLGANNN